MKIKYFLTEEEFQKILNKSVNKSITKVQRNLEKKITDRYFIAGEDVKKSIKVIKPKSLGGEIEVTSKVLGIQKFAIKQTSEGVKAAVSKKKGYTLYRGGFVRSTRDFAGKEKHTGQTLYNQNEFSIRVFKRKDGLREITTINGASIAGLASNEEIQEEIEEEFNSELAKSVNKELEKI